MHVIFLDPVVVAFTYITVHYIISHLILLFERPLDGVVKKLLCRD